MCWMDALPLAAADFRHGRELDSLADIISFGVARRSLPTAAACRALYDRIVLGYFVACGVSRLARYNITADALSRAAR